jgi:hypothetical protein
MELAVVTGWRSEAVMAYDAGPMLDPYIVILLTVWGFGGYIYSII